ncbi:HAD-IA family hydrolase [Sphingomonas sp.]|uniref:HAD-IA family hydrolase n=1 Tax=Sphingomonas sp. TaxID=28214 RepID=UPI003AFF80EF
MSAPRRLVVFDCDGTLIDSQASICAAMDACFVGAGLPPPPRAETRRIVGLSLFEAMERLHPTGGGAVHAVLAERYKGCFQRLRDDGEVEEPLFDGILDALGLLAADGWLLGVATGKSDRGLALALAGHGIGDRFVTLQTADHHPSKPDPSMLDAAMAQAGTTPATTAMIGDTSFDIAMARAAGVRAIGVAWGYHAPDELLAAGADAVARDPAELLALCRAVT